MLALACVVSAPAGAQPVCRPVTLVTSAYPAELSAVLAKSSGVRDRWTDDGVTFYRTEIRGKPIVAAMTGVGIVNATRTANASFADLTCSRHGLRIARIVFSGTAGGLPPAGIGDVAVPATWYLTRTGRALPADPTLLAAARAAHPHLNHVTDGVNPLAPCGCKLPWVPPIDLHREPRVVVGGKGLSSDPYQGFTFPCVPGSGSATGCRPCSFADPEETRRDVDTLARTDPRVLTTLFADVDSGSGYLTSDMETAAVAGVAASHAIPFVGLRGISDGPGDPNHLPGFPVSFLVYQQLAATNAAATAADIIASTAI